MTATSAERFTHVANLMLRGVLVAKPEHVKPAEIDEIVVRPGNADDRVQRSDGSTCIELYWNTPQFRRRQQKDIAAMADADLAAASKILSECGTDLSQSPLAREYLRRKFPLR